MDTVIIREGQGNFDEKLLEAAEAIKDGKLVVFPTETVFGLGANALNDEACKDIYRAKGRPSDNPLIVHVSDMEMAFSLIREYDDRFIKLAKAFWQGPISFVLKKNHRVCETVSAGLDTVAIRMPNHPIALELIRSSGVPIAAPSANISGRPSPTRSEHVIFDLSSRVDYIICSDAFPIGLESTVLDLSSQDTVILRPGWVTAKMIEKKTGIKVKSHDANKEVSVPKSPGTKYKHYSPKAKVYMVDEDFLASDVDDFARSKSIDSKKTKLLTYENDVEMAKNLFADFRQADKDGFELILVKPVKDGDLLEANLNRLKKACEN